MSGKHIASFIGFAPVDDPQIAVLIIVDEPDVAVDFGSVVAAPYVKDVLESSLQYLGVEPDYGEAETLAQVSVPDVVGMTAEEAVSELSAAGLEWITDGTGQVLEQLPAPETTVDTGTTVLLSMDTEVPYDDMEGMVVVPNVLGYDMMEAAQLLEDNKLTMGIEGQGVATYQNPAEGELVPEGTKVMVEFRFTGRIAIL